MSMCELGVRLLMLYDLNLMLIRLDKTVSDTRRRDGKEPQEDAASLAPEELPKESRLEEALAAFGRRPVVALYDASKVAGRASHKR
jgi:hypothetical protein